MFNLRPYQTEAIEKVFAEFRQVNSTLLVKATGTGKTVVFCEIARQVVNKVPDKKVLVLAHRTELLEQAKNKLEDAGIFSVVEKANEKALGKFGQAVVASVQSLSQPKRLEEYPQDYFSLIITDEAHHATSDTYRRIYNHFIGAKHLGVTATPNRHDEIGLKNVFQTCAFQYSIQDGIREGYLCDVRGRQVQVQDLKLEDVKIVAGDFSQNQLDEMLRQEAVLQGMVLPTIEYAEDRPTIVFTSGVEHAHEIAACFNRLRPDKEDIAVAVDGKMDDERRKEAIDLFTTGRRQFIVNVGVLTEGFDYPPTACIALFRPTRSLGLLAQMIGRGTRLAENKTDCLVLDFVGMNKTVKTMSVLDVLDGSILSESEKQKALEYQEEGDTSLVALEKAKHFIAQLDSIKAKMRALSTSNAFDVLQMFAIPSCKGLYGGDLATPKQRAFLEKLGVKCSPNLQKGEAVRLLDQMTKRINKGLATFKQLKYLRRLGYEGNFIENLTFAEAGHLISQKTQTQKIIT